MTLVNERSSDMLSELRAQLSGDVIGPADAEYDTARKIWNGMIDKHPAAIARCAGVSDVIQAINHARTHELPISIRGGSHSAAGLALCDDGVVVDLTRMRGIRVDPSAHTVQAQAGSLWADLDRETQVFGLATTGGTVSNTGVSGLTLGGGLGWLMAKHGLACDNLLSVDLVTAEGKSIVASETEHRICSGRCAVVAATSASRPRSASTFMKLDRSCSADWLSIRSAKRARCCVSIATSVRVCRMRRRRTPGS